MSDGKAVREASSLTISETVRGGFATGAGAEDVEDAEEEEDAEEDEDGGVAL